MRYVLALLMAAALVSPALAGSKHNTGFGDPAQRAANYQKALDAVRASTPGSPPGDAVKQHIIDTIKKNCPTCS